jgi:hypothetical protein
METARERNKARAVNIQDRKVKKNIDEILVESCDHTVQSLHVQSYHNTIRVAFVHMQNSECIQN